MSGWPSATDRNVEPIAEEAERILAILLPGEIFFGGEGIWHVSFCNWLTTQINPGNPRRRENRTCDPGQNTWINVHGLENHDE